MCGRITLTSPARALAEVFGLDDLEPWLAEHRPGVAGDPDRPPLPRFNVAPSQTVLAIRAGASGGEAGGVVRRVPVFLRWGLVPSWAKDPGVGHRMINARAETVAEKPAFRSAFRARRCLIAADGFYEWQAPPGGGKGRKQPWWIRLETGAPFGIAGLWESWRAPGGEALETCTLLTTSANELLAPIHDRMPVILAPDEFDEWLDPAVREPDRLRPLLDPFPSAAMRAQPVGLSVNDPRRDDASCIEPPGGSPPR